MAIAIQGAVILEEKGRTMTYWLFFTVMYTAVMT
jgi:hypothetical protein